ncbi:hypothetical protein GQ543_05595, partial [candidate division WOR-3 bacterium]|nr:hypothetical protein [candidate division WOR-3 bacterium]
MKKLVLNSIIFTVFLASSYLYAQRGEATGSDIGFEMSGLEKPIVSEEYVLM